MTFLLDTNHAIAYLNGDAHIASRLPLHKAAGDTFVISTTVLGELYYGAYASQRVADNLKTLAGFAGQMTAFQFDESAADEFGKIKAEQRAAGKPIPTAGAQIAAVGWLYGFTILTDDTHFQSVHGVRLDNWLA